MRSAAEIETARAEAVEAWHRRRDVLEDMPEYPGSAREGRNEVARREAARDRERQALLARLAPDRSSPRASVVIAHRMPWTRAALRRGLESRGLVHVEEFEDGASALGAVIAEQPDVVFLQQQLPWLDGLEAVRQMRVYAPDSVLVVQLDQPHAERDAREAGAALVLPRAERPADVVDKLCQLVG